MKYWTFNTNICRFERTGRRTALHHAEVAVQADDNDVLVLTKGEPPVHWPIGERLVVAGVEFERELFE